MAGPWSSLKTGLRVGIPAAAFCAIVVSRMPAQSAPVAPRIRPDENEGDLEAYLYSEYPFPSGHPIHRRRLLLHRPRRSAYS